jgi:hypothetical protein
VLFGRRGGLKGGRVRADRMTQQQRSASASRCAPSPRGFALHAHARQLAQSNRVLVQHPESARLAGREFHVGATAARGHRSLRQAYNAHATPFEWRKRVVHSVGLKHCYADFLLRSTVGVHLVIIAIAPSYAQRPQRLAPSTAGAASAPASTAIVPFTIHVPDTALADLKEPLARARLPEELDGSDRRAPR